jgi:septation ring formation regulator EzrA
MTIIPILVGGFGNRLYQIANAFRLQDELNCDIKYYRINPTKEDVSNFNKARKLLMYANAYRSSFTDVARNLTKAETLYFDANFVQAIDVTLEATSRFAIPDSLLAEFDIVTPPQGDN